ncbi:acyltransferase [Macellibacteroides fermentans]|uniref:acyltransferase n=1 Tax=Macellibacteroides fermentans TaxID=879969 RepID=UPI00406C2DF3
MKRKINNIISVVFSLIRFLLIKIFHRDRFKFYFIERFSPNTDIYFLGKGSIILGKKVRAHSKVRLRVVGTGKIMIGDNTSINYGCMLTARNLIKIGKGVEFGPNVLIYDHDHDFRAPGGLKANKYKSGEVIIGDNSWIGAGTIILKNTYIGKNCVVGAGCVISGTFPDNTLIVQKRETTIKNIEITVVR